MWRSWLTHWSSPEGWRRSGHSSLSYSGHSGDLQRSLYTDTSLCCRHSGPHSLSPQNCRYSLAATQTWLFLRENVAFWSWTSYPACHSSFHFTNEPLTRAGIRTVHAAAGVWLVTWGTLITLGSCGVVHATLTHTSTPPPTGLVQRLVKVTALGVVVALTAWGDSKGVSAQYTPCGLLI